MRHGRAKAARKTLQFFERTQGIRPPYHILLDGTFVVAVVKFNFPIQERLDRLLQHAQIHLVTTQSSIEELEHLAEKERADKRELLEKAIAWARQNCESILPAAVHDKATTDGTENESKLRQLSVAGQDIWRWTTETPTSTASAKSSSQDRSQQHHHHHHSQKYFCASQDEELLDLIRSRGCVPVIRLARGSVLLLEHPSKAATAQATQKERQKWKVASSVTTEQEKRLIETARKQERMEREARAREGVAVQVRRKRKAKEPNPLSCKKKKKVNNDSDSHRRKRRRRKKTSAVNGEVAAGRTGN